MKSRGLWVEFLVSEPEKPWLVEISDRVAAWFAATARIGAAMHVRFNTNEMVTNRAATVPF